MRIGTGQLSQIALQGIQRQDSKFADLMVKLSSGERINKISDDALGSLKLINLEKEQSNFDQWSENANYVKGNLEKAETYLDSSYNVLLRIQDLVLTANTDSATQKDRESIAAELVSLKETLVEFANAQDGDGNYIFSGSRINTPALADTGAGIVYQGDNLIREVPISSGQDVATNVTIEGVYFRGGNNFLDQLDTLITDIQGGSATIGTTAPATIDGIGETIDGLGEKLTDIGGRMRAADAARETHTELKMANDNIVNKIKNLDYAKAMTEMNQVQTTLSATQKAYSNISRLSLFNHM